MSTNNHRSSDTLDILVLGATYGLLPAVRLGLAGHRVTLVCRNAERNALAERGATVLLQRRDGRAGRALWIAAESGRARATGSLGLVGPDISADGFDIIILAMSEPQFANPDISGLVGSLSDSGTPFISLMNLPPASYLRRLSKIDVDALKPAYASWDVWQRLDPAVVTAASPDAQAVRSFANRTDHLTVTLASNFKVAPFEQRPHQELLEILEKSTARFQSDNLPSPACIKAHKSLAIPLTKWPMLITGNCRCILEDGRLISIADAVRTNLESSREIYDQVSEVILAADVCRNDLVPFSAYSSAARMLLRPSSFARALHAGMCHIERIDLMVLLTAQALGVKIEAFEEVSKRIQALLDRNASRQVSSE